jgi:hypothetical protein
MLAEVGVEAKRLDGSRQPQPVNEGIAAFVGFGNDVLRGSFAFLGPSELFEKLHPLPPTITPRDLTDWACEMVNQSIGRFRNRLLAYGVSVALGVPQSALAQHLQISSSLRGARTPISFSIERMVLEGWLELETKPGFQLADKPLPAQEEALQEGSMVLF